MNFKKWLIALTGTLLCSTASIAQITSNFSTDADGWTMSDYNSSLPLTVNHNSTGGNPGGYASASGPTGQPYYWTSPSKFGGNITYFSYGQDLKFDLQIDHVGTSHSPYGDVQITTASGYTLMCSLPSYPAMAPAWSTYTLKLDETTNWHINSIAGPIATKTQVLLFLTAVQHIRICTKYGASTFTGGIDNVSVGQRTISVAPKISSVAPLTGQAGTIVTITGTGFDPSPANNNVFFAGIRANISTASATKLVVTVPVGVSPGPLTVLNKTKGLSMQSLQMFSPTFSDGGRLIRDSFEKHVDIPALSEPAGDLAMGDIDGDGWNDLVVSEVYKAGIDAFRNLGTGGTITTASFGAKQRFLTGGGLANGAGMSLADLDNDGKLDAIHSTGRSAFVGAFATFRNISTPGNISFEPVELWDGLSDESPISLVGDIDGDGLPEMIGAEVGSGGGDFWINQNISTPGDIQFIGSKIYPSNSFRTADLVDLNNDGKPELITDTGSTLDIWINNSTPGTISFSSTVQLPITADLNAAFHDLNGDGKIDIVFGNFYYGDDIKIRVNTNSGGAIAASDFVTEVIIKSELSYGNRGVTIADMNGDGKVDIVANDGANTGVFENIYSGGAFDATAFLPAYPLEGAAGATYPRRPVIGDLNGDGKPELTFVTTNAAYTISIFENRNAHAPHISLNTITPLKGPVGSTVTITGNDFSTTPSDNMVFFGAVQAVVQSATETELVVEVPAGASIAKISVTKDRLTSTYHLPFVPTFSPGVSFNNTHFAAPVTFTLTNATYEVAAGDLNLDGKPDVFAEASGNGYAFRNTHTSGTISVSSLLADDTLTSASSPQLLDLNGDGLMEAMGSVGHFRNRSTGVEINFDTYAFASPGGYYYNDFADFNNDGKIETIGIAFSNIAINENRTTTGPFKTADPFYTFAASVYFPKPSSFGSVVAADFDKDGLVDFTATNPNTDNLSLWKNTGAHILSATQFTAQADIAIGDNPSRIYAADIDIDGKMDLLIQYNGGTSSTVMTILRNTSTAGTISFAAFDLTIPAIATVVHISDLDGDGKPDIIATSESTDQFFILKNVSTPGVINASSFATPFLTPVNNPRGITSADLNLDGKPEIIITSAPNSLLVFENLVPVGPSISITTQPIFTYACEGETATFTIDASGTTNITYKWQKYDGTIFTDINDGAGYSGTATKTLSINTATTGFNGNGQYRSRVNGDAAPEVFSNQAQLTINGLPTPPDVTGAAKCIAPSTVTLSATGTSNGSYRWYNVSTGGSVLGTNGSFTTPSISVTTTYYVTIKDTFCESDRVAVDATITLLSKPVLVSSEPIVSGEVNICDGENCTLTSPAGFATYTWSNGDTGPQINVDQSGAYSVVVEDGSGCVSPASDPVAVTVNAYPIATINANGTELTASSGDSYQWYQSGTAIPSATNGAFEFNVLEYGVYTVDVTENGCTTTSDEFVYLITGTETALENFKIYPVPMTTELHIEYSQPYTASLIDMSGREVSTKVSEKNHVSLPVSHLAKGIYFLRLETGNNTTWLRVSK